MSTEVVNIVKYRNRKIHTKGNYLTLKDFAQLIKEGKEVRVRDHVFLLNITSEMMLNTIIASDRESDKLSVETLHKIIRQGHTFTSFIQENVCG